MSALVDDDKAPKVRLLRGGVGVGVATTVASAANYLSNVLLGRGLGPAEFADAALVVSALLLLGAAALGLQLSAARAVVAGAGRLDLGRARRRALITGSAVGLAVIAAAPILATWLHMRSWVPFAVLGLGVPMYFVMAIARGVVQARHQFGRLSASIGIEAITRLVVTAGCLWGGLGATGAAIALTASFVGAYLPCRSATQALGTVPSGGDPHVRMIGATALLLFGQVTISNGDLWVVAARIPDEAGVYASVALIGRLVFITAWSVITVVFPSLVAGNAADGSHRLLRRAVTITAALGGIMTVGAAVFARPLMDVMMGTGYRSGASLLWPYALATTLFVIANLLAVADLARGSAAGPGVLAVGGVAQTAVLFVGASAGAAWVVWAQVMLMAVVLAATSIASSSSALAARRLAVGRLPQMPRRAIRPA